MKIISVSVNYKKVRSWFGFNWKLKGMSVVFRKAPPKGSIVTVSYKSSNGANCRTNGFV